MKNLSRCINIIIGCIFVYTGTTKALDIPAFIVAINNFNMTCYELSTFIAITLPYVEIITGLLLICNKQVKSALLVTIAMTTVFMVAISYVIIIGLDIDCGCLSSDGSGSKYGLWISLVRDIVIALGCFCSLFVSHKKHFRNTLFYSNRA